VSPATLRARAAGYFLTPRPPVPPPVDLIPLVRREPPPPAGADAPAPPDRPGAAPCPPVGYAALHDGFGAAVAGPSPGEPIRFAARAAVLGPAAGSVPAAAALGCALRAAHGFPVAVVATWTPGAPQRTPGPRGPAAPAAARVAARLAARGLRAAAHGRLAWLALDDHVLAASVAARRAAAVLDVPFVVALAGARCDIVEALLAEQDLVLVVTAEPDGALARLAVAACPRPASACPPLAAARRALALSGLAGARALPAGGTLDRALVLGGMRDGGVALRRPR
jgi:hypothetical protein